MILYHGATMRVEHPLCDFGRTDLQKQADSRKEPGILNVYEFDKETAIKEYRYLLFPAYDRDWLHFIVNLYSLGLMDEETALSLLSEHQPNNQICILNQEVVEKYLSFKEVIEL